MKPRVSNLFFFFFILVIPLCCNSYSPPDQFFLDCGASGHSARPELDGRFWEGDISSTLSLSDNLKSVVRNSMQSPTHQIPYNTARISRHEFTYAFTLTSSGPLFIRLYFFGSAYQDFDPSKAFFTVKANQFTLINFSAYPSGELEKEFCINVGEGKRVNITFTPSLTPPDAYAFINGIEIVSMPPDLYYRSERERVEMGHEKGWKNLPNDMALENVVRLNVGGQTISPRDDTGMFREWLDDSPNVSYGGMVPNAISTNDTKLWFTMIPNYSAPNYLYLTARSMGNTSENQNYNLTWVLSLDSQSEQTTYIVRLHFCEFLPQINHVGDREFVIYIQNKPAEENADVIYWTGDKGNHIPYYRDYVVYIDPKTEGEQYLWVTLHPAIRTSTKYSDAILNGLEVFKLSDSNHNLAGPNIDPPPPKLPVAPPNSTTKHRQSTPLIAAICGAVVSGVVALSVLGFFIFLRRRRARGSTLYIGKKSSKGGSSSLPSNVCRRFPLAEIMSTTNDFDSAFIIGRGGFGDVYKGHIDDGVIAVAIKRLKPDSQQGVREFLTEIEMLSQLRHVHLVSLIGYCIDGGEMILVYDYMSNGTLRDHLYSTSNPPLSWKQRLQICIGAAKGLHYLHAGAKCMIIHRDVKTTNILLDDKWVAKVSDFGLSKINPSDMSNTHISTAVKGSIGYLDPEYYMRQQLTEKSDVYSFGVVLLEVLCARAPVNKMLHNDQVNLVVWARKAYLNRDISRIIDPHLKGKVGLNCLNKFVEVAMSCLDKEGIKRPSMNDVVWTLEFALEMQETAEQDGIEIGETQKDVKHNDDRPPLDEDQKTSVQVSSNGLTTTSNSGTSFTESSGDRLSSGAVFSEIMNPKAR